MEKIDTSSGGGIELILVYWGYLNIYLKKI